LFESPLPVGTTLEFREEIAGIGGKVSKYLVTAPRPPHVSMQPRGFVPMASIRDATAAEIAAYQSARGTTPPTSPTKPDPAGGNEQAPGSGTSPQDPTPTNPSPGETLDESLLEPMVSGELPDLPGQAVAVQATPQTGGVLGTGGQEGSVTGQNTQRDLVALTVVQLNESFDQLRALPRERMDAGLEEMLAECRRSAAALVNEPSLVAGINQRIAWLELRIKLRDQRLELERALADADRRQADVAGRVQAWQDQRAYTLIGRLLPSTLYDGNRLPLMYRIEAIEGPGLQRTVGYIMPAEGQSLAGHVGAVVGVIGSTRFDQALGVRIVTPSRVDHLETP
jgi:hypothetical protein